MKTIKNKTFDEERSLYGLCDAKVLNCTFAGKNDGESVLKEARSVIVKNCSFSLRYPLWHVENFTLEASSLDESTRAPIWYSRNGKIIDCEIFGVKCLRECDNITIIGSKLRSDEFGWRCRDIYIKDSEIAANYLFFQCNNLEINNLKMEGKYSFQYTENVKITNSNFNTKDAFWHCNNVTVENTILRGEYIGWYSKNLTLKNCKIIGTQPFCYAENLTLINCTMEQTDLAFEYSSVSAEVKGEILSVKNPKSGKIIADKIGEIILEDSIYENNCEIITEKQPINA